MRQTLRQRHMSIDVRWIDRRGWNTRCSTTQLFSLEDKRAYSLLQNLGDFIQRIECWIRFPTLDLTQSSTINTRIKCKSLLRKSYLAAKSND